MDVCALRRVRCPMKLLDRWYDVIHEQYCYVFCQVKVQVYTLLYTHSRHVYDMKLFQGMNFEVPRNDSNCRCTVT